LVAMLSAFFGGLALLLAALGLYGVTAHAVAQRRAEIGVRMALGATPVGIVGLVLTRVSLLVGGGVAVGVIVSLWASRFAASLLSGTAPRDPATLTAACIVLTIVAAVAGWLPAYRASRVDPSEVLRTQCREPGPASGLDAPADISTINTRSTTEICCIQNV